MAPIVYPLIPFSRGNSTEPFDPLVAIRLYSASNQPRSTERKAMQRTPSDAPQHVELFAIGTELVMGRIYDTNSFWIAEQLAKLGTWPRRILCLADDDDEVISAFEDSIRRGTDVIITTGGLGPTPDDRTLDCVCRLAGVGLEVHRPTVESFVQRRNVPDESHLSAGM